MRKGTPHALELVERCGSSVSRPAPRSGTTTTRALALEVARHLDVRAVDAQHQLGAGRDRRADLVRVEGVDADAHARRHAARAPRRASAGKGRPGVQPMSMTSAPESAKVLGRARRISRQRQLRRVVDLGEDLDVPGAVVARGRGHAEVPGISRRSLGPFSTRTPSLLSSTSGRPRTCPGISTRSTPGGTSRKPRDPLGRHQRGHGDLQHRDVVSNAARMSARTCRAAPARRACR